MLLTPPPPCVLAIASTEYLQSIRCLLKYSLWIKAQYFLASLHSLSCLLLTAIYLPFSPRLLIGLNSFCLLVGVPLPTTHRSALASRTFPLSSTNVQLRWGPAGNFSFLALDLLERFKTPTSFPYVKNVDALAARFFGKKSNPTLFFLFYFQQLRRQLFCFTSKQSIALSYFLRQNPCAQVWNQPKQSELFPLMHCCLDNSTGTPETLSLPSCSTTRVNARTCHQIPRDTGTPGCPSLSEPRESRRPDPGCPPREGGSSGGLPTPRPAWTRAAARRFWRKNDVVLPAAASSFY